MRKTKFLLYSMLKYAIFIMVIDMIRRDKHFLKKTNSYKTQIRVVEGYVETKTNKKKQKTIKDFGYLEDQVDQISFMKMVEEFNANHLKQMKEKRKQENIPFYENEGSKTYNFGYKYLEAIYDELHFDNVFDNYKYKGETSLNDIFKFLVIQRILNPDSKRATYQTNRNFYGKDYSHLSLYQIYRSLEYFSKLKDNIQNQANNIIKEKIGREGKEKFLDVTNFMTTIDYNDEDVLIPIEAISSVDANFIEKYTNADEKKHIGKAGENKIYKIKDDKGKEYDYVNFLGLRKRGVSKEHSLDPIISLGLVIDRNALPESFDVFSGNTPDCNELKPIINKIISKNNNQKYIIVADKGLNNAINISYLLENGYGYVFSQQLKGKKGVAYKKQLFDEEGWITKSDGNKYKIYTENYEWIKNDGTKVKSQRKVLIYWDKEDAKRQKKKRNEKIAQAIINITNNTCKIDRSSNKYIKQQTFTEEGEIATDSVMTIDNEKIKEEEKYDGYFAIVTSELQFEEAEIREVYHGLWRIEESFRISKSYLQTNPIFLWKHEHIIGHFVICYIALLIIRLLQLKLDFSLSTERIIKALNMCDCICLNKQTITCITSNIYQQYAVGKLLKNGKTYFKLSLQNKEYETIEDYKKIIKVFKSKSIIKFTMEAFEFKSMLNSIKFNIEECKNHTYKYKDNSK